MNTRSLVRSHRLNVQRSVTALSWNRKMIGGNFPSLELNLSTASMLRCDGTASGTLAGSWWMVSTRFSVIFWKNSVNFYVFCCCRCYCFFSSIYYGLEILDFQVLLRGQVGGPVYFFVLILCLERLNFSEVHGTLFLSLPTSALCLPQFSPK